MDYIFKLRSAVSAVTETVNSVIPGNPVTREYEAIEQVASAGPGLMWRIYSGRKKSSGVPVSVWVLEKRDLDRWPKREREGMLELLKRGVSQLTRLRHPRMLTVEHGLEESRDSLAFCTEPVFASLANLLGRLDNMPDQLPEALKDFALEDVEVRHGLFQLSEALTFLHNDARMLHRNLCPEAVVVNAKGSWKAAGFDFAVTNQAAPGAPADFAAVDWSQDVMSVVQPLLDYLAPEHVMGGRLDAAADLYSLGVLAYAVFNKAKPLAQNSNSIATFKKNAAELKALPPSALRSLPEGLREDVKMCLNFTPDLRPDATQFSKIAYFDTPLLKTLNYLESLCQMDPAQKSQFFKGLPNVLPRFPKRAQIQKIHPFLVAEYGTPELIPFVLPSVFLIAEECDEAEFSTKLLPALAPVLRLQRPFQIPLLLLQHMHLLLSKTPEAEVKEFLLPLIYQALDSDTAAIQELCLNTVPKISHLVDRASMKDQLLPKLLKLGAGAPVLSVKVNSLLCLGRLLEKLEKWMVTEQVVPMLPKTNSKEPAVLMAVLGIYKLAFESRALGIAKEQLAKSALPYLVAASVETSLNLQQFDAYMALIKAMLAKVEDEQRSRLQQLSALQEEQRGGAQDFGAMMSGAPKSALSKDLQGLDAIAEIQNGQKSHKGAGKTQFDAIEGPLSLEEKRRLAKEQEENIRMRKQSPLNALPSPATQTPASASFANSVAKDPLGDLAKPRPSAQGLPAPPQAHFGAFVGSGGGPRQAFPAHGGFPAQGAFQSMAPRAICAPPGMGAGGMGGGGLGQMQPWGATPPRIGPPPAGPGSMRPMGQTPSPKVDLSAFDSLCSVGGASRSLAQAPPQPSPSPQPKAQPPSGANVDLSDFLG